MKRPGKSSKAFPAAGFVVLLILGLAGQAFANKKPKFVYVTNSGAAASGHTIATFSVTAINHCSSFPCASTVTISGSFTVDLDTGKATGGTMFMSDSSDLASPLALSFNLQEQGPPSLMLFFGRPSIGGAFSSMSLFFPFSSFPATYSGGPLCTFANVSLSGCGEISGAQIGPTDMSASLLAEVGGCCANANNGSFYSGSVTLTGVSGGSQGSGTVSGYVIDSTTGVLTPVPGSPFTAGNTPLKVAVAPSGKFAYVTNQCANPFCSNGDVSAYTINSTTGSLTPIPGSPFAVGRFPGGGGGGPIEQVRLCCKYLCQCKRLFKRQRLGVHHE